MTNFRDLRAFHNWNVEIVSSLKIEFESAEADLSPKNRLYLITRYVERSVRERAR